MSKITSALTPTARRTELGNELRYDVDVLVRMRDILFDPDATVGREVRRSLEGFLARKEAGAPKRGKGARKRRFLRHCLKTAKNWRDGLYTCYGTTSPALPHTSNFIEGTNGIPKHHLRCITGRMSTAGGPTESYGELLVPIVVETKLKGFASLRRRAAEVSHADYTRAREHIAALAEPARKHRSVARKPTEFLASLVDLARAGPRLSE